MAKKKYDKLAKSVVEKVGGTQNINSLFHCVTRLRFKLKDVSKADKKAIENMEGVLSVIEGNGQFQVVIGNQVTDVFDTVLNLYPEIRNDMSETQTEEKYTGNVLTRMFNTMSAIFNPIITALAGAGMIKAILVILTTYGFMEKTDPTYGILSAAGNSVFYFLPLFLAFSSAKTFKVNPFISVAIVGAFMEPNFTALMKANGDIVNFFSIPVVLMGYSGTVIPAILTIWVYSYVERILKKFIPKSIEIFALSMAAILIMVPLAIIAIGPVGVWLGNEMGNVINFLSDKSGLLAGLVVGAGWVYLVMMGIHWGVVPIMINNIANQGYDVIRPMIAAATFATAGVALGVVFRSKNKSTKNFAASAMIPALLGGITEPIVYGLSVKYKKPLIAQTIAGGIAGAFMGALHTKAIVYVFPALTTLPAFFGDTFFIYLAGISMAFVLGTVLTYILGFEEQGSNNGNDTEEKLNIAKNDFDGKISACVSGEVIELEKVNDPAFASKTMGDGVAIIPENGIITSPVDGSIEVAFPTGHAVGLKTSDNVEILIHVGIDTVELNGECFNILVKQGDIVKKGKKLIEFDLTKIKEKGIDPTTMIILTSLGDLSSMNVEKCGKVKANENIIGITA